MYVQGRACQADKKYESGAEDAISRSLLQVATLLRTHASMETRTLTLPYQYFAASRDVRTRAASAVDKQSKTPVSQRHGDQVPLPFPTTHYATKHKRPRTTKKKTYHNPRRTFEPPVPIVGDTGEPGSTGLDPGLHGALVSYASSIGLCTRPLPGVPDPVAAPPLAAANIFNAGGSWMGGAAVAAAAAAEVMAGATEENFPPVLPPPLPLPFPPAATNLSQKKGGAAASKRNKTRRTITPANTLQYDERKTTSECWFTNRMARYCT